MPQKTAQITGTYWISPFLPLFSLSTPQSNTNNHTITIEQWGAHRHNLIYWKSNHVRQMAGWCRMCVTLLQSSQLVSLDVAPRIATKCNRTPFMSSTQKHLLRNNICIALVRYTMKGGGEGIGRGWRQQEIIHVSISIRRYEPRGCKRCRMRRSEKGFPFSQFGGCAARVEMD